MRLKLRGLLVALCYLAMAPAVSAGMATVLFYEVSEPGIDVYISRILVTPTHVRFDEEGNGDFTLYDREQDIVYAVSMTDQTVLVIDPPPARPVPERLRLSETVAVDAAAPLIAGRPPRNVTLLTNGRVCNQIVSVQQLLPEVLDALRAYRAVLARAQQATVDRIPGELQTDCDLTELVYAPERALAHGLPIREQRGQHSRFLIDFKEGFPAEKRLFVLPADYSRMSMPGL